MLQRVRSNNLISSGLEVYAIAKEVYYLVNSPAGYTHHAEDIYKQAVSSLKKQPLLTVEQRLDYRTIRAVASRGRATRAKLRRARQWSINTAKSAYLAALRRLTDSKLYNTKIVQFFVKKFESILSKLSNMRNKVSSDKLEGFSIDDLKTRSIHAMNAIKIAIHDSMDYFSNTVAQNDNAIKEAANYSLNAACEGLRTNWNLFTSVLHMHEEFLFKYLAGVEIELFYGHGKSFKLMDSVREYIEDVTLDVREQESIILGSDGNGSRINLLDNDSLRCSSGNLLDIHNNGSLVNSSFEIEPHHEGHDNAGVNGHNAAM